MKRKTTRRALKASARYGRIRAGRTRRYAETPDGVRVR
jgi:hypothetical protein